MLESRRRHGSFLVRFSEKAINKDQSQEISGQLTLEVLYITAQERRVILKTRQNLKEKELKKTGIVPILLSMEYECPKYIFFLFSFDFAFLYYYHSSLKRNRRRNPLLTTLVLHDGSERAFDADSPYVKSMAPGNLINIQIFFLFNFHYHFISSKSAKFLFIW